MPRHPKPILERLRALTGEKDDNGCWPWLGSLSNGYGHLRLFGGGATTAHKAMYEAMVGPVPKGLQLDHLCRNRSCVNPAHLEPVTQSENILRGKSWSAVNARKTHCPKGHSYDPTFNRGTWRRCRVCQHERNAARPRKQAAA